MAKLPYLCKFLPKICLATGPFVLTALFSANVMVYLIPRSTVLYLGSWGVGSGMMPSGPADAPRSIPFTLFPPQILVAFSGWGFSVLGFGGLCLPIGLLVPCYCFGNLLYYKRYGERSLF